MSESEMSTHPPADIGRVTELARQCWAEILELPPSRVVESSDFYADGGDSLQAVELVVNLGSLLGTEVSMDPLLIEGTFEALVRSASASHT